MFGLLDSRPRLKYLPCDVCNGMGVTERPTSAYETARGPINPQEDLQYWCANCGGRGTTTWREV